MRTAQIGPDLRLVARYLSRVLGSVPERPINTKTRIRILLHFLYLPSYALLRVTICVVIFLEFHSTKQGLPLVDSWSRGLD